MKQSENSSLAEAIIKKQNGIFDTFIDGVKIFKSDEPSEKHHFMYNASIIIILQGKKIGYLNGKELHYNADNYLICAAPFPFECQSFATKKEPLIGLTIDIDISILQKIWSQLNQTCLAQGIKKSSVVNVAQASILTEEMKDVISRLLTSLKNEEAAKILGLNTIEELYYHILKGEQASSLYALADNNCCFTRIAHILTFINDNLSKTIKVENLAAMSNMSQPTFHRTFKKITGESPVQFIKKTRLSRAKNLIDQYDIKVNVAAQTVGYESSSQFSREFKRLFGLPPKIYSSMNNK